MADKQAQVSFDATKHENKQARVIARRAQAMVAAQGEKLDFTSTWMDLIATHANGNPLDFDKLAAADDFNLAHDVFGIARHLNRETGKLENFFSPRCSARQSEAA